MAGGKKSNVGNDTHRVTLRLDDVDYEKIVHWAKKEEVSVNEFVVMMLEQWIDIKNGSYELPTLEVQRLNQLIEVQAVLSRNVKSLETIVVSGFDSLLSLTRGDNYLLEDTEDDV